MFISNRFLIVYYNIIHWKNFNFVVLIVVPIFTSIPFLFILSKFTTPPPTLTPTPTLIWVYLMSQRPVYSGPKSNTLLQLFSANIALTLKLQFFKAFKESNIIHLLSINHQFFAGTSLNWWEVLAEIWRILWKGNNWCNWKQWAF